MNKSLEKLKKIQELCINNNIMIATAESCTGGYILSLLQICLVLQNFIMARSCLF